MKTFIEFLDKMGYGWYDFDYTYEIENLIEQYADERVNQALNIPDDVVSGMLPLTENAKSKLEYINGSCIARNFPKDQPTKQWAGAVLDLLEELGLGN